jgi:hypothetical protein
LSFFLGKETANESLVKIPVSVFQRHFIALGASGSGKTVLCKCVMEEAVRNDVPLIIVDPQGDISSLALGGKPEELEKHGTPLSIQEEFFEKARVAIFTPASTKGIPICVNPLKFPSAGTPVEEAILTVDMTAASLASFLGYDLNSDAGKGARAYLFTLLKHLWQEGQTIKDMSHMADLVLRPPTKITGVLYDLVTKKEPQEIARKLRFLTVGTSSLIFNMGVQIDIDMFMDKSDGKVPVNIIYINTLRSANDKQFFTATLLRELYCWMLRNPSESVQLLFYVDEIAPYIPPYPRNPPPKEAYALLFKQARKYGVGLAAATQNVTDIDYKALSQVNTWCLGRMMAQQDIVRVQKIIQSINPVQADMVLKKLPSLQTGEFLMLSPDVYDNVVDFHVRWLVTDHLTLNEEDLSQCLSTETKAFFEKYLPKQRKTEEGSVVADTSSSLSKPLNERVEQFLNSMRQVATAISISNNLKVDFEDVRKALNELIKTRVVKKGRVKGSSENVYWLSKFRFNPSLGITSEILTIPVKITQVEVSEKAKSMLEGGFLGKKEEVYDAELSHIPIWRVSATRETRRLGFMKKNQFDKYYMSAQTGAIMSLGKKDMVFRKLMRKGEERPKDFDDDENFAFERKLPGEMEVFPSIRMGADKIYQKLQLTLAVKPVSAEMILLPVWTLKIRHKKALSTRTIVIDAVTGRTLSGYF